MEILRDLNPAQQAAVTQTGKPLLILAGAGSGKTRVLTYRAAYLIQSGLARPEEILLMTFTNKAAGEMLQRVNKLLVNYKLQNTKYNNVVGGTYHSFCARLLRKYAGEAGLSEKFVIFDTDDQIDTIKRAMAALGIDAKSVKPSSVLAAISSAKNELVSPADYANFARGNWATTVSRIYMAYQLFLKKFRALDFDDLLVETVLLLQNNPEVLESLQDQYQQILVDEYQDTNKAQYQITKMLAKKHRHLTVVGDAAQAIYSWRGADYRNMLLLKQDFPDLVTINLEQNYRSTQIILNGANEVVSKNKNHPILKLWTERQGGEKITIYEAESELDEAEYTVRQIFSKLQKIKDNYSNYAILYRTNAQSRVIEEALIHTGIPYSLVGGVRFYERKEIKDVLAYLRLLINPDDEVARKRAEKLGKNKLNKIMARDEWHMERPTIEILDDVLRETDYLNQYDELNEEDAARLENIKELRSVAEEFPNLVIFLENVTLTEKESKKPHYAEAALGKGAVTLMTLHAAKGLEFPTVFMVGMEEGLFPHSRALMNPEEMEEERRLCYVGMTRAMNKLYMSYARRRLYFGQRTANMVSRFLGDIPEKLIESNIQNEFSRTATSKGYLAGKEVDETQWGFDEEGNWKWKP